MKTETKINYEEYAKAHNFLANATIAQKEKIIERLHLEIPEAKEDSVAMMSIISKIDANDFKNMIEKDSFPAVKLSDRELELLQGGHWAKLVGGAIVAAFTYFFDGNKIVQGAVDAFEGCAGENADV